jgi:hypothetical protein
LRQKNLQKTADIGADTCLTNEQLHADPQR